MVEDYSRDGDVRNKFIVETENNKRTLVVKGHWWKIFNKVYKLLGGIINKTSNNIIIYILLHFTLCISYYHISVILQSMSPYY